MASISVYLQKILAAVYGEEVRGSIHDAIKAINDESASAYQTAVTSRDSAANYAAAALEHSNTAAGYKNDAANEAKSAQSAATTARTHESNAAIYANKAAENALIAKDYVNEAKGYRDTAQARAEESANSEMQAKMYADEAKRNQLGAENAENETVKLIERLERYIVVMEQFSEFVLDYEMDLGIQDSDGDVILDSNGEEITSYINGFKAFTTSVTDLQKIVSRHTGEIRELQSKVP